MENNWPKKNLLLVGASGGIGSAIYERMIKKWNIFPTSRTQNSNNDFYIFDHRARKEEQLIDDFCKQCKTIDCIIIASGITSDGFAMRLSDEDWDNTIEVNLSSAFRIIKHGFRKMSVGSSIIMLSSVIARFGNSGQSAYAASKGGIEALTRTLAKEFAKKCRVNAVAPGFIDTKMTENLDLEEIMKNIPLNRRGRPEEVAHAVEFLVENTYITGHTLEINGGMYMG